MMRVTQGMITNDMLHNLSSNNNKMDKYLDQLSSGKKTKRPSDDPVAAMKGIDFHKNVSEVSQFKRNTNEVHTWMDNSDASLDKATQALQKLRELATEASNDTYDENERKDMKKEAEQLKEELIDIGNTKINDKYIFNGSDTNSGTKPIDKDGERNIENNEDVTIEVAKGTKLQANVKPDEVFNEDLFKHVDTFIARLGDEDELDADVKDGLGDHLDYDSIDKSIGDLDESIESTINARADLGARMNRLELVENRLDEQEVNAEKNLAENEDVDYEKAITNLMTQESMHQAALSAGSRIIQPSLVDFLN